MNLYIFNPQAKNARKLKGKIKTYLAHLNLEGEFVEAKKKEDVTGIVKEALERKVDTIVAIGGDGIVNRVIQVIAEQDINLGVIPIGSTNFLANFLKINSWRKGCEILVKKEILNLNLGKINGERYFISSVELESDGDTKKGFWKKNTKGYTGVNINIENPESSLKVQAEASSIMVSSIPFPVPANIDLSEIMEKEELNIIIKNKSKNKEKGSDEITVLAGRNIKISAKQKMDIKMDGERMSKDEIKDVKIEMVPKSLRVVTPKQK